MRIINLREETKEKSAQSMHKDCWSGRMVQLIVIPETHYNNIELVQVIK